MSYNIFSIQINITKISPNIVNTNNNINLEVCILNNDQSTDNLITLNIYYPYCLYSNTSSVYIPYLEENNNYCTYLNVYDSCNPGAYDIVINGSYVNNNGVSYTSQIYPIIIQNLPYITINNIYYNNNYYGAISNITLNITNNGGNINNVLIESNSTECALQPTAFYLNNLNSSQLLNFQLIIPPNYADNYCTIPINIQYEDSLGNIGNYFTSVNVPIINSNNRIELLYNISYLNIGNNIINLTIYNPTNSTINDIAINFEGSNISIENNNIYINSIKPGQYLYIPLTIVVPNNVYGTISIPFQIQYYSNSILNNLSGNIIENINTYPNITISGSYNDGTITFNIFNYGYAPAYNMYMDVYCSNNCIITPDQGYIGELDPGNSNSVVYTISSENPSYLYNSTIIVKVYYSDIYGNYYVLRYNIPLKDIGYNLNIKYTNNNGSFLFIIVSVIIIIIAYYIYRRKKHENR